MSQAIAYRVYDLPWTANQEQEQRFRRVIRTALVAGAVLALLLSVLPVPDRDQAVQEIPPRLARLIVDQPPPPPPPPVREERQPEPVPEPAPVVEQRVVEPEPRPVDVPPPVEAPPPAPQPVDRTEQARERARSAGVLPFAEQLSALRESTALESLGAETRAVADAGAAAVPERSLITSRAGSGSGGINTAALSRDTGGAGLAGRETTRVESSVEGLAPAGGANVARVGQSDRGSRSREEIERVFDQNKGAIFALYQRALRQNPALEGQLVLRLTIAPDGRVTACEVVSSELGDPELEQRLVQRVLLFQFEAKDVEPITTTKPIDFFPA